MALLIAYMRQVRSEKVTSKIRTRHFSISNSDSTYFIADIAANHDGSLQRAKDLIKLAAENGANAAKFQNFLARTIVSRKGFQELGQKLAHQAKWDKDVYRVYEEAELPWTWTEELAATCEDYGIDYFTAPYDLSFVDKYGYLMDVIKVGSGDITWTESLRMLADTEKYIFLATGASSIEDVRRALRDLESAKKPLVLMQCNTNYTGSHDNFQNLNLNVLSTFSHEFPDVILGLSDHTPGHIAVLGAVALGARVIEKHFTDDQSRKGPDHNFSLSPIDWRKMVEETRKLEASLGDGIKRVESNEIESSIVQRRALRFHKAKSKGDIIRENDLIAVRPCPVEGIPPYDLDKVLGKILNTDVFPDELVTVDKFESP